MPGASAGPSDRLGRREPRAGAPRPAADHPPRLGQGAFRIAVLDAYRGACAVTTEHSLGGDHDVTNGIPLRRDLHRLFDLGYMTVRPDHRVAIGAALREGAAQRPRAEFLDWHSSVVFRG